jgi:hypothetical protein
VIRAKVHSGRATAVVAGLAAIVVALTGCGEPAYTYVKNSDYHTYFKVPRSWHRVDQAELIDQFTAADPDSAEAQIEKRLIWLIAYDADPEPAAAHILASSDDPFVMSSARPLTEAERGAVSFDMLRDIVLPVTDNRRKAAEQAGLPLTNFELLHDEVLTPGAGIRGVRVVYNYQYRGLLNTFDLTAYVNDDASRMYFLLLRCSARCYRKRTAELAVVTTSFTVRSRS